MAGRCQHEFNEMCCKPRARCFKGFAILTFIYALGAFLMLLVIPLVTKAHHGNEDPDTDRRMHLQITWSLILGVVFTALSILNWVMFGLYRGKEALRRSVLEQHTSDLDD